MKLTTLAQDILRPNAPTLLLALGLKPPYDDLAAKVTSPTIGRFQVDDPMGTGLKLKAKALIELLTTNQDEPKLYPLLKEAEAVLVQYESENNFQFKELGNNDRWRSSEFDNNIGFARKVFKDGMSLVGLSIIGIVGMITACSIAALTQTITPERAGVVSAAFGLIGTVVGFLNGIAANVVSFYWGSSQGSKEKGDQIAKSFQNLSDEVLKSATVQAAAAATVKAATPAKVAAPAQAGTQQPQNSPGE
jgi:hypothetical protein